MQSNLTGFKGRFGEYAFASKAALMGLVVGFPSIEAIPYDFFVDNGKTTHKVQVKTIMDSTKIDFRRGIGRDSSRFYSKDEVDFFIAYFANKDLFYIFPHNALTAGARFTINDGCTKLDGYKEAWHLLKE